MKTHKLFPCKTIDAILRVTYYEKGMLTGWLSHVRLDHPLKIQNVPQLLFALDEILSQEDAPIVYHTAEDEMLSENPIATIWLQILFREHHTWQGRVIWENQHMEAPFRSVLELIEILDEILGE